MGHHDAMVQLRPPWFIVFSRSMSMCVVVWVCVLHMNTPQPEMSIIDISVGTERLCNMY